MKTTEKKRFNVLDVVIVLVIIAAVAAFFLRGQFAAFFRQEAEQVVTYSYRVTDIRGEIASALKAGGELFAESGKSAGKVLTVNAADATDAQTLSDGQTVYVKNGLVDLEGTISANGYESEGFVYLECGLLLVPGKTVVLSTGDALFALQITGVEITDAPSA
ncbi:MAG: DUF4330 family protein [Clostridia bacterium]|nr:DUF4330 family protein [Clostridia bacterium]MBQ3154060.1 DUF4330 family protein [Clostridia bacterium]